MTVLPFKSWSGHCLLPQPDSTGYSQSARFNVSVMFLSLYILLFTLQMQKCCCKVSINVAVAVFVYSTWSAAAHILFQWRLRRHCIITADSNRDENTHASSFKKVTMLRVIYEKESKSRLKESNSGSTVIHHDGKKCGIGALVSIQRWPWTCSG